MQVCSTVKMTRSTKRASLIMDGNRAMLTIFATWLATTSASHMIQSVSWVIPLVQVVHILAISVTLSSVGMIDLRILGWAGTRNTLAEISRRYVPWIWGALLVLACTGAILITAEPSRSLPNPAFRLKMVLLLCAIIVTASFQITVSRGGRIWDFSPAHAAAVKTMAIATLLLWFAIAVAGRWIAYLVVLG